MTEMLAAYGWTWTNVVLAAVTGCLALAVIAMAIGRNRVRPANPTARERRIERRWFIAALVPSLMVILAVMAISFFGLASFGRDVLRMRNGLENVVPLSLDGISISFGFWAFVAIKRGRHPGRAEKIVIGAALMSAAVNYTHGRDSWGVSAGLYLAFLSIASAGMFHELLGQFNDAQAYLNQRRRVGDKPRFGERWLYAPYSTFAARRAWIVDPPAAELDATVRNALQHWRDTRRAGQVERQGRQVDRQTRKELQAAEVRRIRARLQPVQTGPDQPALPAAPPVRPARPVRSTRDGGPDRSDGSGGTKPVRRTGPPPQTGPATNQELSDVEALGAIRELFPEHSTWAALRANVSGQQIRQAAKMGANRLGRLMAPGYPESLLPDTIDTEVLRNIDA